MKTIPRRQFIRRSLLVGSFLLFPITICYFSPALIIMAAAAGILAGSAVLFICQFLSALFLGRAFCGWVCAAGGLQEACFIAQSKRVNVRKCDWIKYAIWAPWIGLIVFLLVRNGVHSVDFFFMMDSFISLSSPGQYPIYLIVIGLIFILSLTVGRRAFCHTACWMAPFMIIGSKVQRVLRIPSLHLRAAPDKCVGCRICTAECSMSLEVEQMVKSGDMSSVECILCGNCVDSCKHKAIAYCLGVNRKREENSANALGSAE